MQKKTPAVDENIAAWLERVASFFVEQHEVPPTAGRMLGWLMICDPPEQSLREICAAIGTDLPVSSIYMRQLVAMEWARRVTRTGEHGAGYYRFDDRAGNDFCRVESQDSDHSARRQKTEWALSGPPDPAPHTCGPHASS